MIISTDKGRKIAGLVSFEVSFSEGKTIEFSRKLEKCPDNNSKLVFSLTFTEKHERMSFLLKTPSSSELKMENSFQFNVKEHEETNESFNGVNVWQALENSRQAEKKMEDEIKKKNAEISFLKGEVEIKTMQKENNEKMILEIVMKKISSFLLEDSGNGVHENGNKEVLMQLEEIMKKFKETVWIKLENKKLLEDKKFKEEIQELKKKLKNYEEVLNENRVERDEIGLKNFEITREKDEIEISLKKERERSRELLSNVQDLEKKLKKTSLEIQILNGEKEAFELERATFQRSRMVFENQISENSSKINEMIRKFEKSAKEIDILKKEKEAIEIEKDELHKMFETHTQELKNSLSNALAEMKVHDNEYQILLQEKESWKQNLINLENQISEKESEAKETNLDRNRALLEISVLQKEKNLLSDRLSLEIEETKRLREAFESKIEELNGKIRQIMEENQGLKREKEESDNREKTDKEELCKNKEILKKLMMEIDILNNEKDNMELKETSGKEQLERKLHEEAKKDEEFKRMMEISQKENIEINEKLEKTELKFTEENKKVMDLEDKIKLLMKENEENIKERRILEELRNSDQDIFERTKETLMIHLVEVEELKMEIESLQKQIEELESKINNDNQSFQHLRKSLERQIDEQTKKIGKLLMENENSNKEKENLKQKLISEKNEYQIIKEQSDKQIEELRRELVQKNENLLKEKDSFEQRVSFERQQSFRMKDNLENELGSQSYRVKQLSERKESLEKEVTETNQVITNKETQIKDIQKINESLNDQIKNINKSKQDLELKLTEQSQEIKELQNQLREQQKNNCALEIQVIAYSNEIKDLISQIEIFKQPEYLESQRGKENEDNEYSNDEALKTIENLQKEKASLESHLKTLNSEKSQLKSRVNFLIDEKNLLKIRVADLEKQAESLNNYLNLTLSEASELQKNQFYLERDAKKKNKSLFIFSILNFCLRNYCYKNSRELNQENRALKRSVFELTEKITEKNEEIQDLNDRLISKELDNTYLIEEMLILKEEMEDFIKSQKRFKILIFCQNVFRNVIKFNIKAKMAYLEDAGHKMMEIVQKTVFEKIECVLSKLEELNSDIYKVKKKVRELTEDNEKIMKENENLKSLTASQKLALKNHLELQKRAMFLERQLKNLTDSLEADASLEKKGLLFEILQEKSTIKTQNDKIKEMEERVSRLLSQKSKTSTQI